MIKRCEKKEDGMNFQRFSLFFLVNFFILGFFCSSNLQASSLVEELGDEGIEGATTEERIATACEGDRCFAVDKDGNVLQDLTQKDLEKIQSSGITDLKELQKELGGKGTLLEKTSREAQELASTHDLVFKSAKEIREEGLITKEISPEASAQRKLLKNTIEDTQEFTRLGARSKLESGIKSDMRDCVKDLKNIYKKDQKEFSKIASDLKPKEGGIVPPQDYAKALKGQQADLERTLKGTDVDGLNKLDLKDPVTGQPYDKTSLETEIKNVKTLKEAEDLKIKLQKLKRLSELSNRLDKIDSMAERLPDLKSEVDDLKAQIKNFATKMNHVAVDSESLLKEATHGTQSGLHDAFDSIDAAANPSLDAIDDSIGETNDALEELRERLPRDPRFQAAFDRFHANVVDELHSAAAYMKDDLVNDVTDGFVSAGKKIRAGAKEVKDFLMGIVHGLAQGVLFMVPNIFQSAFLAQKQRQAELETLARPIKFGKWVFQIPDSCFNFDNPAATIPVYVRIPVSHVGDPISQDLHKHFDKSISSASTNNAISSAIHSVGGFIFSLGADLAARPSRYKINEAAYLSYNPGIILTYFTPGGYQTWGSVPVTSSQFTSGQLIDVTTGLVIDGSGQQVNATNGIPNFDAYPLLVPNGFDWHGANSQLIPTSPADVKSFTATMHAKLDLSDDSVKYVEYSNVSSGSAGPKISEGLTSLFNCSCLEADGSSKCDAFVQSDATTASGKQALPPGQCLLAPAFDQYQSGLCFNADGSVGVQSTPVGKTATPNYLGSVVPLYGWGSEVLPQLINQTNFPDHPPLDLSSSVATRVATAGQQASGGNAEMSPVELANPAKNYSALGCWVYLSSSTPFAQAMQASSTQTTLAGPYVDYIIFLDEDNNQVPLMVPGEIDNEVVSTVPGQVPATYTNTGLVLNPAVKYWTSIAAINPSTFSALSQFADPQTGNPIKYDLHGGEWADANLAGAAASNQPPGTAVIASAVADLQNSFGPESPLGNLYTQFSVHQKVMLNKLANGPFAYGNTSLTASDYEIVVPGSTSTAPAQDSITLYEGAPCYSSSVSDILVAYDNVQGQIATLPDANATEFYSLVTDIAYQVQNGSLVAADFSNAPLTSNGDGTYSLNTQDQDQYYVMDSVIEKTLDKDYPLAQGASAYVDLCNGQTCASGSLSVAEYVMAQRKKWIAQFDSSAQKQGITVGSVTCCMPSEFSTKAAIANKAYIYEVVPSPSAALCDHDLFVLVNGTAPALASLAPLNAQFANAKTSTFVSLVSGFLFDVQGNQLMQADGVTPQRLSAPVPQTLASGAINKVQTIGSSIYSQITTAFDFSEITTPDFAIKYQNWVDQYENQMHRPMGPYTFGKLTVDIMAGDFAIGNYVYLDAAGAHRADFVPRDVFITYDPVSGKYGHALSSSTTHMLSLVSGNLYDAQGTIVSRLPAATVTTVTSVLSVKWGNWLTGVVNERQQAMNALIAAAEQEQAVLDGMLQSIQSPYEFEIDPISVSQIIKRLQPGGLKGLPAPYGLLKYDSVQGHIVHVSPASSSGNSFLYLFFDVGTDKATGNRVGAIYQQQALKATMLHVVKGAQLEVLKRQFGVVINSDGTQTLGVPMTQPSFIMTPADQELTMGSNSSDQDLICSNSDLFPGGAMNMRPGNHLYYSQTMQAYYVYNTKQARWIAVVGDHAGRGHVYAKNGDPIPVSLSVALNTKANSKNASMGGIPAADDMILLSTNAQGGWQGAMSNGQSYINFLGKTNDTMNWTSLGAKQNSSLVVDVNASNTTFTVKDGAANSKSTTYKIDKAYEWYSLFAISDPIDAQRNIDLSGVDIKHRQAQLVKKDGRVAYLLFNGAMYKVSPGATEKSFTMVPVQAVRGSLKLSLERDPDTRVPYVQINDGKTVYRYLYMYESLSQEQLLDVQAILGGGTATATRSFNVGSPDASSTQTITIGKETISVSAPVETTNVLFAKNIPKSTSTLALTPVVASLVAGVPEKTDPRYQEFNVTAAAFYENLRYVVKSSDGRFFVQLPSATAAQGDIPSFSYVSNGAYVDLFTGILYSTTHGVTLGYCLNLDDLLSVLDKVYVTPIMATGETGSTALKLFYRSPKVINVETEKIVNADTATV
jgi:hypothetical protein